MTRSGDWLIGARYRIARMDLFQGRVYQVWDWFPEDDWAPRFIAPCDTSEIAIALIDALATPQ